MRRLLIFIKIIYRFRLCRDDKVKTGYSRLTSVPLYAKPPQTLLRPHTKAQANIVAAALLSGVKRTPVNQGKEDNRSYVKLISVTRIDISN